MSTPEQGARCEIRLLGAAVHVGPAAAIRNMVVNWWRTFRAVVPPTLANNFGLKPDQISLDRGRPTNAPKQGRQSEH